MHNYSDNHFVHPLPKPTELFILRDPDFLPPGEEEALFRCIGHSGRFVLGTLLRRKNKIISIPKYKIHRGMVKIEILKDLTEFMNEIMTELGKSEDFQGG